MRKLPSRYAGSANCEINAFDAVTALSIGREQLTAVKCVLM